MSSSNKNTKFLFRGEPSLTNLFLLLGGVYQPLFANQDESKGLISPDNIYVGNNIDFLNNLKKFTLHISHILQQISGEVSLDIPNIRIEDVNTVLDNETLVILETALENWTQSIRTLLEKVNGKEREGDGPLSEIEYWRTRHAMLGAIWEQLNDKNVKRMVDVLQANGAQMLPGYEEQLLDLTKLYMETKDNVKFLSTLERHFKNIARARGTLLPISDTLPSMMNAIKMVWRTSRHYNSDKRMIPLMELIAHEIADKVALYIDLKMSLQKLMETPDIILKKLEEGVEVLRKWRSTYENVRLSIEKNKRDIKWNFDRDKLFERTEHMAERIVDVYEIASVVARFKKFLGPELRAVTGDTTGIDEILGQVKNLLEPLQQIKYDIFDRRALRSWTQVMKDFREKEKEITKKIHTFIDKSFQKLRSAESAFQLLQDVKSIQSQDKDTFNKNITLKSINILERYKEEIDQIHQIFKNEQKNPPRTKNMPPAAGAIYWSDSLFQRIYRPMALFQSSKDMLSNATGESVKQKAVAIAKDIKGYEEKIFKKWVDEDAEMAVKYLKETILVTDQRGNSYVNFHPSLLLLIQETKYLDKLGKKVQEIALNVTLQEEKYHGYVENLKNMLNNFNSAITSLDQAEAQVLKPQINRLHEILEPGFKVLNWNSLGIEDFIRKCNLEINEFQNTVKKIQKNASTINALVQQMKNSVLIKEPVLKEGELLDLQQLYNVLEQSRNEQTAVLVKKYKTISQTLMKIEGDLISSNVIKNPRDEPGREPSLSSYYSHWEMKIFKSLVKMVKSSFNILQQILQLRNRKSQRRPILKMVVSLTHSQITRSPDVEEITKMIDKIMQSIIDGTKAFVRWMHGTCIEVTTVEVKSKKLKDEEDIQNIIRNEFSFFKDISQITHVLKLKLTTRSAVNKTIANVIKSIKRRFSKFEDYWKIPRDLAIEKFGQKKPKWSEYDSKLEEYTKLIKDLQTYTKVERKVDFIQVDCSLLVASIQEECSKWIAGLGKLLNEKIQKKLYKLNDEIEDLTDRLHRPIEDIESLREVLSVIDEIRSSSVEKERKIRLIEDCYNTLKTFNLDIPKEERRLADHIDEVWFSLVDEAISIDNKLVPQKNSFTDSTIKSVNQFSEEIDQIAQEFEKGAGNPSITDLDKGLEQMTSMKNKLVEKKKTRDYLVESEKLFNLPITSYPKLVALEKEMNSLGKIYEVYAEWKVKLEEWSKTLWAEIPLDQISKETQKFVSMMKSDFSKQLQNLPIHKTLRERIKDFQTSIPLFTYLKSDALRARHWDKLMESTGVKFDMNPQTFTLQNLMSMELHKFQEQIKDIYVDAQKELKIETMINEIEESWRSKKFQLKKHIRDNKDRGNILVEVNAIKEKIEDDTTTLSGFSGSRHAIPFSDKLQLWEKRLSTIEEVLESWIGVQTTWIYLEIIFIGSPDIREQLKVQARKFDSLDAEWAKLMTETAKTRNVLDSCLAPDRLKILDNLQNQLNECQKGLTNYLQTKRDAFPRFYFISDDELLTILGSSDLKNIQKQMMKMFDNTEELMVKPGTKIINGMKSPEEESFLFNTSVPAEHAVEKWLSQVETEMRKTLKFKTKEAVFYYPKKQRVNWIKEHLGMITLCGSQIWWTWEVEDAFRRVKSGEKMAVKNLAIKLTKQLNDLVDSVRTPLEKNSRKKVTTLIIVDVHARDIVDSLVRDSILDERNFEWESQLRFYWDKPSDDVKIRQCTGEFDYGYEYMGLNGRLVITPLTDRCFMTLTQALTFNLGGSPAGPAGTGKTESVKDLAKSLAVMCRVFNCGEGLDYKAMHVIFAGLCQTGAWGCFDEFNRIDLPVLSVVSTQIRSIQHALTNQMSRFRFEDSEITLKRGTGIFITMNPGYAGRVELPDNLKVMFRPCVMVVPDMEIICEIMLLSEGFNTARQLARKMTKLYKLAEGQLSKQSHYDWGLRGLKAVLVVAGRLKKEEPEKNEQELLMRALRDMNMPKFIFEDVPLFTELLNDLFVSLKIEKLTYPDLQKAIEKDLEENCFQILENQVSKIIQFYETLGTRHCVMVVGGTCGGKSVVIETLKNAQTNMKLPTKIYTINPKAQNVSELYGDLDEISRDWTDGLLSSIFRLINQKAEKGEERRYILFDGDVDAVWIENMNSVMDDNKLLTLPNSERISLLYPQCSLLFEVGNLSAASPATVSRCGMVFVDPKNLGYEPYVKRWIKMTFKEEQSPKKIDIFTDLFTKYISPIMKFMFKGILMDGSVSSPIETIIPISDVSLVAQLCAFLQSIFFGADSKVIDDEKEIECLFIFSLYWSIGAAVTTEHRKRFDNHVKEVTTWSASDPGDEFDKPISAGFYPKTLMLYDYFYDIENHCWKSWKLIVPQYEKPIDNKFSSILVPTVDTVRYTWLLKSMLDIQKPVLFVGGAGTAKTVIIQSYLKKIATEDSEKLTTLNINMSSRTSALDIQLILNDNMEKRYGDTWGPRSNKHMNIFIDDLNMPIVDMYGTQQPIALLKLIFEKGGMYERNEKGINFIYMKDIQFIAAMAPPGGGRNSVDPRFISKFIVFNVSFPSDDSLKSIYSSILNSHIEPFAEGIKPLGNRLTEATLELYEQIVQKLPPTPSKFHYVFNLRDLSRVYEGLCLSTIDRFTSSEQFVRLWRNECLRVFHDRLTTQEDKLFVQNTISDIVKKYFEKDAEDILKNPILFADFVDSNEKETLRLYEEVKDIGTMKKIVEDLLETYNESNSNKMNLVMFEDAMEHLIRIHRIIRMNRGHALLVGVGGSGKQSLTKLATFIAGYDLFQISLCRGYSESHFKEDLRILYTKLGVENKKIVFLFTDAHVIDNGFLEFINNMLTTGQVPALFPDQEKEPIYQAMEREIKGAPKEQKWNYFIEKCRDNLHIVLAMSPAGDTLRIRCRNFPGLVNNTSIDWFMPWPEQALKEVASKFLEEEILPEEKRHDIIEHMVIVHGSVTRYSNAYAEQLRRHNYVTPKNYLDYISTYRNLLAENRDNIDYQSKRLEGGLHKLLSAKDDVEKMKMELSKAQKYVTQKTIENNELLEEIAVNTAEAQKQQQTAQAKEKDLEVEYEKISKEKAEAEKELKEAEPQLEAAEKALKNLNTRDIVEIKTMISPPEVVQDVCACVAILLADPKEKKIEANWRVAKSLMSDASFITKLTGYDKERLLTQAKTKQIAAFYKKNGWSTSSYEFISGKSQAAAGLFMWIDAMQNYYKVYRSVKPKKDSVEKAEKSLAQSKKELAKIKQKLQDLATEISSLNQRLEKGKAEANSLKEKADTMEKKLKAANKLINGLGSERIRWIQLLEEYKQIREKLVGDCLLCSSFLSYTGAFTVDFRKKMIDSEWFEDISQREIPISNPFKLDSILTNDVQKSEWIYEGLPPDDSSIQNGILTTRASRFPLCIDPQQQAIAWIKSKEKELICKTFNDEGFMKDLENAIRFGKPFLFENVDEYIDPMIDPILEMPVSGKNRVIRLSGEEIDVDDSFRLYLCSRLPNPHYSPDVYGKTMVINYSVTEDGLRDQLLNAVVNHERPEIEDIRKNLVQTMSKNKSLLKKLEDKIVQELNLPEDTSLIENEELIETLEETKTRVAQINEEVKQSEEQAIENEKARNAYNIVAKRGSILFFVMANLVNVNSMYEYSLASYMSDVFEVALVKSEQSKVLDGRLDNIIDYLTHCAYIYTCTGLFEKHKLTFAFQMTIKIMQSEGKIEHKELDFFLKGNISIEKVTRTKPVSWLSDQGWKDVLKLSELNPSVFADLPSHIEDPENQEKWKEWFDCESPELQPSPFDADSTLSNFHQLCLLRCFRIDRILRAVTTFISTEMKSEKYVKPPVLEFENVYRQSNPLSPIVCMISPGYDPAGDIIKLAEKLEKKYKYISLGQGQGDKAKVMLEKGITKGHWVLLQNCHLLVDWMKNVERKLDEMGKEKVHSEFRLWLTTEATKKFPIAILQKSLKVVTEPPNSLLLNMRTTYSKISEEQLSECPHPNFRSLVYVLSFFHAVIQERRKYGKIGWNVPYDFNKSDFDVSMSLLKTYLTKAHTFGDPVPWDSLKYLIGECMYGGRVTDSYDRRVLTTYLDEYMGDFLFDKFQPFHFFMNDKIDYRLPDFEIELPKASYEKYIDDAILLNNSPDVFGLHPNAEIGYQTTAARNMWADLIELQARVDSSSSGISREEYVGQVASGINEKIPEPFDRVALIDKIQKPSPTQVVLLQEVERWNLLVSKMKNSLFDLKRAFAGEIGMSNELDELTVSLHNGTLPIMWAQFAPSTKKNLSSWLDHFSRRHQQYTDWIKTLEPPKVIWLSGLHIPDSYLAAIVQMTCKKYKWPLDRTTLFTQVTHYQSPTDVPLPSKDGCYVHGLFMEGASWNSEEMYLEKQKPKELLISLPVVEIIPVENSKLKLQNTFKSPVYVTSDRRNAAGRGMVFEADLSTHEHQSHWILQGVAVYLNDD